MNTVTNLNLECLFFKMAVFMLNICKFNGCGISFPTLFNLIQHIEETHIDLDPLVLEQKEASQPQCIHLSYVLRFYAEGSKREPPLTKTPPAAEPRRLPLMPKPISACSNTTGSEVDEEELSPAEDSNDSWTTGEEYNSDFLMRYSNRFKGRLQLPTEKPFLCPVPGCNKRYKNVNGMKYHSKNGHKNEGKMKKAFKCHCGKSYKSAQGLKNHSLVHYGVLQPFASKDTTAEAPKVTSVLKSLQRMERPNLMKPNQGILVTPKHYQGKPLNVIGSSAKVIGLADASKPKVNEPSYDFNVMQNVEVEYEIDINCNDTSLCLPLKNNVIQKDLVVHGSILPANNPVSAGPGSNSFSVMNR